MSTSSPYTNSQNVQPMHGHVPSPASRAYFAWLAGLLDSGALNQLEKGKHFPATAGGLKDPLAPQDVPSAVPPIDGKIASAEHPAAAFLDKPGDDWEKHSVHSGDTLAVSWGFSARHSTRRWNYFLTRPGWDSALPLSRAQFETTPFHVVENKQQPYWAHRQAMLPPVPTVHPLLLPTRVGYQVLLCIWEIAETGAAFYQVIDLLFGAGNRPDKPTGLTASGVTDTQVVLTWSAGTGPFPIVESIVLRDGIPIATVQAPLLTFTDGTVDPDTPCIYTIKAVDDQGNVSLESEPVVVLTLPEGKNPHAVTGLHSMGQTANSIDLMWTASAGPGRIKNYAIYRDATPVGLVTDVETSFIDTGLMPDTAYQYFVKTIDEDDHQSKPSNSVLVKTKGEGSPYPAWELGTAYEQGAEVSHDGEVWVCIQAHTSHDPNWAPGVGDNVLWVIKN